MRLRGHMYDGWCPRAQLSQTQYTQESLIQRAVRLLVPLRRGRTRTLASLGLPGSVERLRYLAKGKVGIESGQGHIIFFEGDADERKSS